MQMDQGKSKIGTSFGAICTLFMAVIILLYTVRKTSILIRKEDTNLQQARLENNFDLSQSMTGAEDGIFFAFYVSNLFKEKYRYLDTSFYSLEVISIEETYDENDQYKHESKSYEVHPCTDSEMKRLGDWYAFGSEWIDSMELLSTYKGFLMCLDNPDDVVIYGTLNSPAMKRLLYVQVNKCTSSANNDECKSDDEIDKALEGASIVMYYRQVKFDHNEYGESAVRSSFNYETFNLLTQQPKYHEISLVRQKVSL